MAEAGAVLAAATVSQSVLKIDWPTARDGTGSSFQKKKKPASENYSSNLQNSLESRNLLSLLTSSSSIFQLYNPFRLVYPPD